MQLGIHPARSFFVDADCRHKWLWTIVADWAAIRGVRI